MNQKDSSETNKYSVVLINLLYLLVSIVFCYFYYKKIININHLDVSESINSILSYTARKPFQFRLLYPYIYKIILITGLFPAKTVAIGLNVVVVYLILVVYRLMLNEYFESKKLNFFLALFIIYPMIWNYIILNQMYAYYDFTAIFVYTLGMYLIIKDKFILFLVVFTLGLLNKETAAYLIFAYLLFNYNKIFNKNVLLSASALITIFIVVKVILYYSFLYNQGDPIEICLYWNIEIFKNILHNRIYAKNLGFCFGGLYIATIFLFLFGKLNVIRSDYYTGKLYINLVFIIFLMFGFFIVYFTEVRVYSELIPIFTTLFLLYLSTFAKLGIKRLNVT